eukprot:Gb_22395 [translate_table: standard]
MRSSTVSTLQNRFFGEPTKGFFNPIENSSESRGPWLVKESQHVSSYIHALGCLRYHKVRDSTYFSIPASIRVFSSQPLQQGQHGTPKEKTLFQKYKSSQYIDFEYGRNQVVSATLSSFAESDGEDIDRKYFDNEESEECPMGTGGIRIDKVKGQNQSLQGMAEAFNISPRTAFGIAGGITFAALVLPLSMKSLGHGLPLKVKSLSYLTLLCGFYMAWNIGANDVANAMGTSVGSGALTLRQAVLTAAILEFSGALLMGSHVSVTMQKGILVSNVFNGKDSLLFAGMLSSLAAAGTWLQLVAFANCPEFKPELWNVFRVQGVEA